MTTPAITSHKSHRSFALFGPNRFYHGWHIAWVAFLATGFTVGMTGYAFGVFIEPLEAEFGWTRSQITAALSIAAIPGFFTPFVAGRLVDKFGVRPVMAISLLIMAAGFAFRPFMSELWHFYAFTLLVSLGGPGATGIVTGKLVGIWFPTTRGRMMGTVTAGNNFGGLTMAPLAAFIVAASTWEWAFVAFGAFMSVLAVGAWFIIREDSESVAAEATRTGRSESFAPASRKAAGSGFTLKEALNSPAFYLITLGLMCASMTYQGILTQVIPHLENEGLRRGHAVAAQSLIALFGIGSKLVFGGLTDKIGARMSVVLCVGLQAAGTGLMILPFGAPSLWAGVFVFGLGFGGLGALIVLAITETFGLKAFGSIMGVVSVALTIPQFIGPLMAGWLYDATGSYRPSFGIVIAAFAAGIVFMLVARTPRPPAAT